MQKPTLSARAALRVSVACALSLSLAACFDDDDNDDIFDDPPPIETPAPSPAPAPAPTIDVGQCLSQQVFPDGTTVLDLVVPDVLTIDPALPAGFPNGRKPVDPVVDITLAALFLDISAEGQSALSFANLPLNPDMNDIGEPPNTFPFLLPPQGNPPISGMGGTNFNFRTDGIGSYTRVDRMGFPAVSTALVPSDLKIAYNDANPVRDASGEFAEAIVGRLTTLTEALQDDLTGAGFDICAD